MSYQTRHKVHESVGGVAKLISELKKEALEQNVTHKQAIMDLEAWKRNPEKEYIFPDYITNFVIDETVRQIKEDALNKKIINAAE